MKKYIMLTVFCLVTNVIYPQSPCPGTPTVTYEGKTYNTVQIGAQCWLKENLDIGKMLLVNQRTNDNGIIEKFCYDNKAENCDIYGGLYDWDEAMEYCTTPGTKGICPDGWNIPTLKEIQTLGASVINNGNTLKALGQGVGNGAGTNTSGFSALLSGWVYFSENYNNIGISTLFWSSTENDIGFAYNMSLLNTDSEIYLKYIYKSYSISVRCIKGADVVPPAPTLYLPGNGSNSFSVPLSLMWKPSKTAMSYILQVSADSSFTSFEFNGNVGNITNQTLIGLSNSKQYYWRVSAANKTGVSDWSAIWSYSYINVNCNGTKTLSYLGKTYNTIQIGNQCWLKENLDVGTMIKGNINQTNNGILEKYCYNDDVNNCNKYGGLYQWAEAVRYKNGAANSTSLNPAFSGNIQGICPNGWHIPTKEEFEALGTTVSNNSNALKAIGQGMGSGVGTNTSSFSALLAGCRDYTNTFFQTFYELSFCTYFCSSTETCATGAYFMFLYDKDNSLPPFANPKDGGYSVRCAKDFSTDILGENDMYIDYSLSQNYPNPFNPTTTISYQLSAFSHVILNVYDILGVEVATLVNDYKAAGSYIIEFNAGKLASGIYFYTIQAGNYSQTKQMVLIK